MKYIKITGGKILSGEIEISGAKNSAVALVPIALLSDGIVEITNVPEISDIDMLIKALTYLEAKVVKKGSTLIIDSSTVKNKVIPEEISSKLRASYYFMSALLSKFKKVEMFLPGGCNIGSRPIDQTLKSFKALGAKVVEEGNKFTITAKELKGATVALDMPSVGATVNAMITAVKAKGKTIIENAAREPEIVNIAIFLNNMGAKIQGAGTTKIIINGVENLKSGFTEVIPDRIEAGTYIILGALIGNKITVKNIIPEHVESLTSKLTEMGVSLKIKPDSIEVSKSDFLKQTRIKTAGYPGFATDLQQPITVLLTQAIGKSILEETIYENRFKNVPYMIKMGANIKISSDNHKIEVFGQTKLTGQEVEATDLRAGISMVLAGLVANNTTKISDIDHILRGYEGLIEKLRKIGADISVEQ